MKRLFFLLGFLAQGAVAAKLGTPAPQLLQSFEVEWARVTASDDSNVEMYNGLEQWLLQRGYKLTGRQIYVEEGVFDYCLRESEDQRCDAYQYVKQFEGPEGRRFLIQEGQITLDPSTQTLVNLQIKYQGLTREPKKLGIESEEE